LYRSLKCGTKVECVQNTRQKSGGFEWSKREKIGNFQRWKTPVKYITFKLVFYHMLPPDSNLNKKNYSCLGDWKYKQILTKLTLFNAIIKGSIGNVIPFLGNHKMK